MNNAAYTKMHREYQRLSERCPAALLAYEKLSAEDQQNIDSMVLTLEQRTPGLGYSGALEVVYRASVFIASKERRRQNAIDQACQARQDSRKEIQ